MKQKPNYKYNKKIDGLFGISLPPKKKKRADKYLTIRFLLTGFCPSKKNEWIPATNWWTIKPKILKNPTATAAEIVDRIDRNLKVFIRGNNRYVPFIIASKEKILEQAAYWSAKYSKYGLMFPIEDASIRVYYYWKDNIKRDNTNKSDTIHDLLVEAGIITDDSWQFLNPIHAESECYAGEIHDNIIEISITVRIYNKGNKPKPVIPISNSPDLPEPKTGITKKKTPVSDEAATDSETGIIPEETPVFNQTADSKTGISQDAIPVSDTENGDEKTPVPVPAKTPVSRKGKGGFGIKLVVPAKKVKEVVPESEKGANGIDIVDLNGIIGWYEESYDPESETNIGVDMTPHPNSWTTSDIAYLKSLNYNIELLKKHYS